MTTDEEATSLYDVGWRQGSVARAALPCSRLVVAEGGSVREESRSHKLWVVATQDCDLALPDSTGLDVELRPVVEVQAGNVSWGIHSRVFRISDDLCTRADDPRRHVDRSVVRNLRPIDFLGNDRQVAFKTWLGRRYNRPAVPESLVPLMREIAKHVSSPKHQAATATRDILVQVDEGVTPPRYSLYGVLAPDADATEVRAWLADVSLRVSDDLGIADRIEVALPTGISLELIETSYAADVMRVTWRGSSPSPIGARPPG